MNVLYRNELYRKIMHVFFGLFPVAYLLFLERDVILWLLGILTAVTLVGELLRMRFEVLGQLFRSILGSFVREGEYHSFTGATYTLTGSFLTVLIFEKNAAVFGLLILAFADSTAALVGRKWGRTSLLSKTAEGTATFMVVALVLAIFVPGIPRSGAVAGALVATLVELLPSPVNDNVMIPISAALTLSLVNLII